MNPKPDIPTHLRKYIVEQNHSQYTAEDHAVWRFIMRQLKNFLETHAHPCYAEGLSKTGIEIDQIPKIANIDRKLQQFGWRAVPVSGFIPPAAFMEFQSLSILPIASDMRTLDHILYTPAPDIVHEAAGHAPILVDPKFSNYLKKYAVVAKKSIISKEDVSLYEAIRSLSDIKENPNSSDADIAASEAQLKTAIEGATFVSEAALLGRMNWWTAEYGLIGDIKNPKIFGAGLLSSLGESRSCLEDSVKKIPLTVDCVDFSYDITEPQPQLFVTPDFETLELVLDQLSERMSYRRGGSFGLKRAQEAKTVNTVELNSGLQISSVLSDVVYNQNDRAAYLKFTGPSQLCFDNKQLAGHDKGFHCHGYSTPVGLLENANKCLSKMTPQELEGLGLREGVEAKLTFDSGVIVAGKLKKLTYNQSQLILASFENCKVSLAGEILFDPDWGTFDMAVGSSISSVFGGPADSEAYGEDGVFAVTKVPAKNYSPFQIESQKFFEKIRRLRETSGSSSANTLAQYINEYRNGFSDNWLIGIELLELCHLSGVPEDQLNELKEFILTTSSPDSSTRFCVEEGLRLACEMI